MMAQSNFDLLGVNLIVEISQYIEEETPPQVSQFFLDSSSYNDIIFVLKNLHAPPELSKTKSIFLKKKAIKFCMLNDSLYWKDPGGVLFKCLTKFEAQQTMKYFHEGYCGVHQYWKTTINKILRSCFYWTTIFVDVYNKVSTCHECQIFEGK
jgi:hypothetical protein